MSDPEDDGVKETEVGAPDEAVRIGRTKGAPEDPRGESVRGRFGEGEDSLAYRLYLPPRPKPAPPLVMVLHGCTQDARDAAAGTRMDGWADRAGFLVLYPEQRPSAHPLRCWRWFEAAHQRREAGEPALLAGMIREVARTRGADPERVYVVGLSAGGAMALSLGALHPELVAAVGVHSGMPFGVATGVAEAEKALAGGGPEVARLATRLRKALGRAHPPPLAVFQGGEDAVVNPANAGRIVEAWLRAATGQPDVSAPPASTVEEGTSHRSLRWTRRAWAADAAGVAVEWWTVEGLGHAWSGGDEAGTFTDPRGPDATAAFLRFFSLL